MNNRDLYIALAIALSLVSSIALLTLLKEIREIEQEYIEVCKAVCEDLAMIAYKERCAR